MSGALVRRRAAISLVAAVLATPIIVTPGPARAAAPIGSSLALVTVNAAGTDGIGGGPGAVNADGTKVAFSTDANVAPNDTNGTADIYLRDLVAGTTTLVSVNAAGTNGANSFPGLEGISADGTKVLFESFATDLVTADSGTGRNVYLRDVTAGTTTLVSVTTGGIGHDSGQVPNAVMSADGTKVVFTSHSSDLGPTDPGNDDDLYLRDLTTDTTTLVTVNTAGTDGGNSQTFVSQISSDGTKVLFDTGASDLTALPDTNNMSDVFIRDVVAGTTTMVSVNGAGTASGNFSSSSPSMTPDGKRVAFNSAANDLGPADSGADQDVYVRDVVAGTTVLASVNAAGTDGGDAKSFVFPGGSGGAPNPVISADGNSVVFMSVASNLGPPDAFDPPIEIFPGFFVDFFDVYVRDLAASSTTLVTANSTGTDGGNFTSGTATISSDGQQVAFDTEANNLGPADAGQDPDVYLRDLESGVVTLVSRNASATDGGDAFSSGPIFSIDGTRLVFLSAATDLGPPDPGPDTDVYISPGTLGEDGVEVVLPPGGTTSTGSEASAADPVETSVTSPTGGTVTIEEFEAPTTPSPDGFAVFGTQVVIEAPPAESAAAPLVLGFRIDSSLLPPGVDQTNVAVLRNGVVVPACTGASGVADPDPCVSGRALDGNDVVLTVLTTQASTWNFAEPLAAPPPPGCPPNCPPPPPEPVPPGDFLFSVKQSETLRGSLKVKNEDVVRYRSAADRFELVLDGSDVGLSDLAVDAHALLPNGDMALSFTDSGRVPGLGKVDDSDLVRFHPTALGPTTRGTFSWFFDGSDIKLSRSGEDVDAVEVVGNDVYLSTTGSFSTGNVRGADEDVFVCRGAKTGADSGCAAIEVVFEGSDAGLSRSDEDVDGLAFSADDAGSTPLFSTTGNFSAGGIRGEDEDVFACNRALAGCQNTPTFTVVFGLVFKGEDHTVEGNDITAIEFGLAGL